MLKNDIPNLSKKSSGLLNLLKRTGGQSILFLLFQFIEGHKRLSRLFSGNLLAMFDIKCCEVFLLSMFIM